MFGKSSASRVIIDQEPEVTHRRSRKQNAVAIQREPPRDVQPRAENWRREKLRPIGKAGWIPAFMRHNTSIADAIWWNDVERPH